MKCSTLLQRLTQPKNCASENKMKTEFYKIENVLEMTTADAEAIKRAAEILTNNGLVAFPTETVYGLGASAYSWKAATMVYEAKGRPSDNPLIVHVSSPDEAESFAQTNDIYYDIADRFMPGPVTVILKKNPCIPDTVTGGLDSVAVRCPSHPVARALIHETGIPIAAPSANLSGRPSPTTAGHVLHDLDGRIPMIIDGGPCRVGLESTVIRPEGDGTVRLLRPGAVTVEMLRAAGYNVLVDPAVTDPSAAGKNPESPGMKYKHYAPEADVYLVDTSGSKLSFAEAVMSLNAENSGKTAVICYRSEAKNFPEGYVVLDSGGAADADEHARRLFANLRQADESGVDRVYCHLPEKDGIGLAVYNRVIRACSGRIIKF